MGRPRKTVPSYRPDQPRAGAKCVVADTTIYFPGDYNSPESLAAYRTFLAGYMAGGQIAPRDANHYATCGELILAFDERVVTKRYIKGGQPTSEQHSFRCALRPLAEMYAGTPANEFLPRDLKACRKKLIEAGYTRTRINQHVGRIRRMFKWGVEEGLVPVTVWQALTAVEGLRYGEAQREAAKVPPAPEDAVAAVQAIVTPPLAAVIQTQLWTGCRPGEALAMRTCDILAEDPLLPPAVRGLCWVYRPKRHKTEHHGKQRVILLGPQARAIVEPWLRPAEPEAYLFSPVEAREWFLAQRRGRGKPRRKRFLRKANPRRAPGSRYKVSAYDRAIRVACDRAGLERWHPHQLRHNAGTRIRAAYGVEVARIILGHAHIATTEIYAEADLIKAAEAMAAMG